jgi:hypothetical protein
MTIPDIIDDQRLTELLFDQGEIIERIQHDEAAAIHIHAYEMGSDIIDYLDSVAERATAIDLAGAKHLIRLADYARQLTAHHLDYLDRLNPA